MMPRAGKKLRSQRSPLPEASAHARVGPTPGAGRRGRRSGRRGAVARVSLVMTHIRGGGGSKMAAPMEVAVCTDSAAQLWSCVVWELHSGANLLTYRGGQAGPRGLALLNGEYLLAAQLGKNYINAWELQRKVGGAAGGLCARSPRPGSGKGRWVGRTRPASGLGGEGGTSLGPGALRMRGSGGLGGRRALGAVGSVRALGARAGLSVGGGSHGGAGLRTRTRRAWGEEGVAVGRCARAGAKFDYGEKALWGFRGSGRVKVRARETHTCIAPQKKHCFSP